MGDGSVNIDDIKGRVSGVSYGSTGSLSADVIRIEGNLTINIINPTKEVVAELRKILEVPIEASEIKDQATKQKVKETRKSIDLFKNLLSEADEKVGAPTQSIRAGNVELSRDELFLKDAGTMAYEYLQKGDYHNALEWSDKAILIDPNNALAWDNKGAALTNLNRYNEAIQCIDRAIQIDPNFANAWYSKGWSLERLGRYDEAKQYFNKARQLGYKT